MRLVKIGVGVGAALALALALTLTLTTGAHALPGRGNPPSGPGYVWGTPITALPACGTTEPTVNDFPEGGGWSDRTWTAGGVTSVSYPGVTPRPVTTVLGEPCYYAAGSNLLQRIRIPWASTQLNYNTPPPASGSADIGHGSNVYQSGQLSVMKCASAEWQSATPTTVQTTLNAGRLTGGLAQTDTSDGSPTSTGLWSGSTCAYVQSIELKVCRGLNHSSAILTAPNWVECETATWTAEGWFQNVDYPAQDPLYDICQELGGQHADCVYIDPPDDLSLDVVCAYPPTLVMEWGNWNWLPDTIEHYARCLFSPPGGWDRQGLVANAWETSPFTDMVEVMNDAASAFTFYEGCGVILNFSAVDSFDGATGGVDSCTWTDWAPLVRSGIGVVVTLGFAWWAVQFCAHTIMATFRAVPMIDPVTYSTMIYGAVPPGGD